MSNENLPQLNRKLLTGKYLGTPLANYSSAILNYPERVI
jgi:hypothetical protein